MIITERDRLLVTLASVGISAIVVLGISAQFNGIDGHAFTACVSAITGISLGAGAYLYGKFNAVRDALVK